MEDRLLPDWSESFMEYTENSEAPVLYRKWTSLSLIASALQRKCYLEWDSRKYANMYIVLVGPSGCRKGTAMNPGMDLLTDLGVNVSAEATTREALIRKLEKSSQTEIDEESDTVMSTHSSLSIFSQELTVFLGYNNPQLMADLADWYDCRNRWTYETKTSGTDEITGVFVNLIGGTTPELIQSALPLDAIGGGLASRIIFVYADRVPKLVPFPFRTDAEDRIKEKLESDLNIIRGMKGIFTLNKEALSFWGEWYIKNADNPPFADSRFSGYISRRPNHILKMAMLISASRSGDLLITREILEEAIDLLKRTEVLMPKTFAGFGRSELASTINKVMKTIKMNGEIKLSQLMNIYYLDAKDSEMTDMLNALQSMKKVTLIATSNDTLVRYVGG